MNQPTASGGPAPIPSEVFAEILTQLSQNSRLLSMIQSMPPPAMPTSMPTLAPTLAPTLQSIPPPPPPTQGCSFSRTNRGMGGVLTEKERVSKEITAPATKCKSLVDPHTEVQVTPTSEVAEGSKTRQTKHQKLGKVWRPFRYLLINTNNAGT